MEIILAGEEQDTGDSEEDKGYNKAADSAPEEDVFEVMVDLMAEARDSVVGGITR